MDNLKGMTDEELALSYVGGNNKAFDLLLSRTQSKLFSYILFVVHDHDRANDVFQETFVKVITKLHQGKYVNSGKFSAWLMRIAHNVIMDWYRDHRTENIVEPNEENDLSNISSRDLMEANVESQYVNTQVLNDVTRMMNQLPPTQREVVYMRFYQDMSFKEIAETTGVSINTSLGRMRYAVMNMRKMAREHQIMLQLEM
jgi:RNA polymerase sigma-70 factor (ECF subfamily)